MTDIIFKISLFVALVIGIIYACKSYKYQEGFNFGIITSSFLSGLTIIPGTMLFFSLIFDGLWDLVPNRDTIIAIGAIIMVLRSIEQLMKNNKDIKTPRND